LDKALLLLVSSALRFAFRCSRASTSSVVTTMAKPLSKPRVASPSATTGSSSYTGSSSASGSRSRSPSSTSSGTDTSRSRSPPAKLRYLLACLRAGYSSSHPLLLSFFHRPQPHEMLSGEWHGRFLSSAHGVGFRLYTRRAKGCWKRLYLHTRNSPVLSRKRKLRFACCEEEAAAVFLVREEERTGCCWHRFSFLVGEENFEVG
jgi:hypothetical protein